MVNTMPKSKPPTILPIIGYQLALMPPGLHIVCSGCSPYGTFPKWTDKHLGKMLGNAARGSQECSLNVQLMYQVLPHPEYPGATTTTPELTSDHDNGRPDIIDRCGRPRTSAFQADEGYLFFDHIYSTSYETTPKRHLTSFAVTRDFFHSFFGTAEDELEQPISFRLPPDNHGGDREDKGGMQDIDDAEGPPANQRPSPQPEVTLPPVPPGPVEEDTHTVTAPRSRSLDGPARLS
ncbi:hypothetical protein F5882DRAFT_111163 [Hyaloscypha sp. PMI_1271]|nr:hypothetical protein F5882DRAFT_111163 [Hyaloscypha sp. PMI_1271]